MFGDVATAVVLRHCVWYLSLFVQSDPKPAFLQQWVLKSRFYESSLKPPMKLRKQPSLY